MHLVHGPGSPGLKDHVEKNLCFIGGKSILFLPDDFDRETRPVVYISDFGDGVFLGDFVFPLIEQSAKTRAAVIAKR